MPYFRSCECPPGHMGYPGSDVLCCTPTRFATSGFGAGPGRHFAPARPVAQTEYTTLEREAAKKGLSQSSNASDYQYVHGSSNMGVGPGTSSQYALPQQTQIIDPGVVKLGLSTTDWILIGAGVAISAAAIYAITRKS